MQINVDGELPKEDKMVLIWSGYPTEPYMIASYSHDLKLWIDYNEFPYNDTSTFWQPLPSPPKP